MIRTLNKLYENIAFIGDSPNMKVCDNGFMINICLQASAFDIKHKEGKAEVILWKDLLTSEARKMAQAVLEACDKIDAQKAPVDMQTITICDNQLPPGVVDMQTFGKFKVIIK